MGEVSIKLRYINRNLLTRGLVVFTLQLFSGFTPVMSATILAEARCHEIAVPALNAAEAIRRLAKQTGAKLLFGYELAKTRPTQPVKGCFSVARAMEIMFKDSGLKGVRSSKGAFVVVSIEPAVRAPKP